MPTIDELDQKYGISGKVTTPVSQPQQTGSDLDWLPTAGGIIGGIGGAALGSPLDVFTGPLGTAVGGVAGAGVGGTVGKSVENIINALRGQKQTGVGNLKSALLAGAEQAPWGVLGGEEEGAKLLKPLAERTLARGGLGAAVGGASQAIQNIEKGKPIGQDVGTSALGTGIMNAVIPGVTKVGGEGAKAILGTASDLKNQIARFFVGNELSRDPQVTQHLDLTGGDWLTSKANLEKAKKDVYQPIVEAVSAKTAKLGDFLDSVENGLKEQGGLTTKEIDTRLGNLKDYILRNSVASGGIEGLDKKISGTVLNNAKQVIGKWYKEGENNSGYTAAKKFIEDLAPEADVEGINKAYAKYSRAIENLNKNFADKNIKQEMNKGMNLIKKLLVAAGAGIAGGVAGVPTGNIYATGATGLGVVAPTLVLSAIKDELTKYPERAAAYASKLESLGQLTPEIRNLIQQIMARTGQSMGQQSPNVQSATPSLNSQASLNNYSQTLQKAGYYPQPPVSQRGTLAQRTIPAQFTNRTLNA